MLRKFSETGLKRMSQSVRFTIPFLLFVFGMLPSAEANTITGYITVNGPSTYVSGTFNSFGEYDTTTNLSDALLVSFDPTVAPFSLTETNNPASSSYPYFGGVVGFASTSSNLGAGSFNYTYLGGTIQSAANATPGNGSNSFTNSTGIPEQIESGIWSISNTDVLTAQWINTDSSAPATYVVTASCCGNEVLLTGDPVAFGNSFGTYTLDTLTFVCTAQNGCPLPSSPTPEPSSALLFLVGLLSLGVPKLLGLAKLV